MESALISAIGRSEQFSSVRLGLLDYLVPTISTYAFKLLVYLRLSTEPLKS